MDTQKTPLNFLVIGLSHKTSPVEVREKFHFSVQERELLLSSFKSDPRVFEAIAISTCNRTEVYVHLLNDEPDVVFEHIFRVKKLGKAEDLKKYFYMRKDEQAVEHLFEVACGLNSLVLGEKQILGQVKEAVAASREMGMLSRTLNILTHLAIRAGKKAQHETEISSGGSSVSWAAITMAQKLLGTIEGKDFLMMGAGKMGALAANYLHKKNVGRIFLMNRTEEKAVLLAENIGAQAVSFWKIKETLLDVDVCMCASAAPHYLIGKELAEQVMAERAGKPLIFMDMSVPRNIDPQVAHVKGAMLFTVDDLEQVVKGNCERRQVAVEEVRAIIDAKVNDFYKKISLCNSHEGEVLAAR